jgi:hypothetical protein
MRHVVTGKTVINKKQVKNPPKKKKRSIIKCSKVLLQTPVQNSYDISSTEDAK